MKHPVVTCYTESRKSEVSQATCDHTAACLNRILDTLERDFTVLVTADAPDNKHLIEGLDGDTLRQWYNRFSVNHRTTTRNHYVHLLNLFLHWAHTQGATREDLSGVLRTVRLTAADFLPTQDHYTDKYLAPGQVKTLLTVCAGNNELRNRAIIALFLYSGIRAEDLGILTVGMVQDRNGFITIERENGQCAPLFIGKGFWPYLDDYLSTRPDAEPNDPLFITASGSPCSHKQLWKSFEPKRKIVGFAFGPRILRHTFFSEVAKIAGSCVARDCANRHHLVVATDNHCNHARIRRCQAAVDRLRW